MSRINFFKWTYFSNFLCLGFCLCLVSADSNTKSTPAARNVTDNKSKESYEDYEANEHDAALDDAKPYTDENIEGIRKFDQSIESEEKLKNVTKPENLDKVTDSSSLAEDIKIYDTDEKSKQGEDEEVFEDSELNHQNGNISGIQLTKIVPEILKYGKMVLPSSEELGAKQYQRVGRRSEDPDSKTVIQKLSRSKIDQDPKSSTVETFVQRNVSRLDQVLDLFDLYRLFDIWPDNYELNKLSPKCYAEMGKFMDGLKRGKPWALKMFDSGGHYGGSYFWGNPYWMGSRTLCREISSQEPDLPFSVEFSIAAANLSLNIPGIRKHGKSQYIGICLPYSCNKDDVHILVEQSLNTVEENRETEVIRIKSHYDYYYMAEDKTFWLVVVSSVFAFAFLFVGTVLDISIEKQKKTKKNGRIGKNYKYDNYTYAVNPPVQPYMDNAKVEVEGCMVECRNNSNGTITPTSESDDVKHSLWQEILLSFSVIRNMRQICDSSIGADTIPIIHGLRSISMGWVILGHTCIVAFKYSDNMEFRKVAERELLFQTINNSAFTVDTFFFISGLLVSFLYFRTMAKVNVNKITKTTGFLSHCIEFIGLLGYRFCRLTVPYIFTLGLVEISMKWFYYNSVFDPPADDHLNCPNYWWRNLLYVNTLFPVKEMCMLWSWYLADDTQFYILGIILLILAVRHFRAASISVAVLLVCSWCTTGYIAYSNNHMPNMDDPLALFDKIYDKPWTRFGPYLIGMIVGWILFKTECKIPMKKSIVVFGWIICTMTMLCLVYGLYKTQLDSVTAAAYSSLSHTVWALGLSWIVIACTTGHGGYANKLLSSKLLIPFSRTTYCAYLIHPIVIRWVVMRRDSPVHLAEETIAIMFLGQLVASYILAFVLSIAFEAPIVSLLKIVSPTKRKAI